MTIKKDCQQNTNNDDTDHLGRVKFQALEAIAAWQAKLALSNNDTPFVKSPRIKKVDASRQTEEGKAFRNARARATYKSKVEAAGKSVRPINVPDSEEKREKRTGQYRASKRNRRAVAAAKPVS